MEIKGKGWVPKMMPDPGAVDWRDMKVVPAKGEAEVAEEVMAIKEE